MSAAKQDVSREVEKLIAEWGWANPPEEIRQLADLAVLIGSSHAAALRELTTLTEVEVARLQANKPAAKDLLSYAAEQHPSAVQPVREQIVSMTSGSVFYRQLSVLSVHPEMGKPEIRTRCDGLNCVLMTIEARRPVLVFGTHTAMTKFETMGRTERERDPLTAVAGERPLLAVGSNDDISVLLARHRNGETYTNDQAQAWHATTEDTTNHPERRELIRLLDHAISTKATDIALVPNLDGSYGIFVRRWGALTPAATGGTWPPEVADAAIQVLQNKSGANPDNTQYRAPLDGQITYRSTEGDAFMRLSFIPLNHAGDIRGRPSVSIRLFSRSEKKIDLDELNLPTEVRAAIEDAIRMPAGGVVVAGPMNSGKSTTIGGMIGLHHTIFGDTKKRVSVEDPIERHLGNISQFNVPMVMHRRDGTQIEDQERFNTIMRGLKRHDVNVFWIGEVRDPETAEFCVNASVSGCLALATLHAKDCVLAFDLLSQYVDPTKRFQLAEAMSLVISQRLVPALCEACKAEHSVTPEDQRRWNQYMQFSGESVELPAKFYQATSHADSGCTRCQDGYSGYALVCEVLPFTREVRTAAGILAAREPGTAQARDAMAKARTLTMVQSAHRELCAGRVDMNSVLHL